MYLRYFLCWGSFQPPISLICIWGGERNSSLGCRLGRCLLRRGVRRTPAPPTNIIMQNAGSGLPYGLFEDNTVPDFKLRKDGAESVL